MKDERELSPVSTTRDERVLVRGEVLISGEERRRREEEDREREIVQFTACFLLIASE